MAATPRFQIGDRVTVRRGTRDPDFADIPLGGWTGTIRQLGGLDPEPHYLVAWNDYTLANMHPVFRQRCLRDDLEAETMWLRQGDLEPAPDQQPALDQPERLDPRPLQLANPADRIRSAFGLTTDDPLPPVDAATLRQYHAFLTERLAFPLQADFLDEEAGFASPPLPVQVLRLWPIEDVDPEQGLQAEVREGQQVFVVPLDALLVRGDARAMTLVQDYTAWYVDWAADRDEDEDDPEAQRLATASVLWSAVRMVVYGAGCGACVGAVLTTIDQARVAFAVGAFLLGALGYLSGAKLGGVFDPITGTIRRSILGTFLATLAGVVFGGVVGVLVVAALGSIPGSIAFNLVGSALHALRVRVLSTLAWTVLGAFIGALTYALLLDQAAAINGAFLGAAIGGGGVVVLLVASLVGFALFGPDDGPQE